MDTDQHGWTKSRYAGFDYLRAWLSLAVVAWHMLVFGKSSIFDPANFQRHRFAFSDAINFHLLLLAVPTFYLISTYLFVSKVGEKPGYFLSRLKRISYLYMFWTGLSLLIWFGFLQNGQGFKLKGIGDLVVKIVSGFGTPYYFFSSLILLIAVIELAYRLPGMLVWLFLACAVFSVGAGPLLVQKMQKSHFLVAFWSPINFLPYAFISILLHRHAEKKEAVNIKTILTLLVPIFIGAAIAEWKYMADESVFTHNPFALPAYTRVSIIAGSCILFLGSFRVQRPPGRFVGFLSDYSLGLYCLHPFILILFERVFPMPSLFRFPIVAFSLVVCLSLATAVAARRVFGKGPI